MKWSSNIRHLAQNPLQQLGANPTGAGMLHSMVLTDTVEDKEPFNFTTVIYIPDSMDLVTKQLSLQQFEASGREQLLKKHDMWLNRDVKDSRMKILA